MGKILKIIEKKVEVEEATLPDGIYIGTWGGNVINVRHDNKEFELETEEGVRGIGYKVVVTIKNNEFSFEELSN